MERKTEKLPKIQADEGDLKVASKTPTMTFPNQGGEGVQKNATIYHASSQIEETDYNFSSVGGVARRGGER